MAQSRVYLPRVGIFAPQFQITGYISTLLLYIPLASHTSRANPSLHTFRPTYFRPTYLARSLKKKKPLPQKAVSPRATPRIAPPPSSRPKPHPPPGDAAMRMVQTLPASSPRAPPYSPNRWRSSSESADYFGRANPTMLQHQQRPQLSTLSRSISTPLSAVIVPLQTRFPAIDPIRFRDHQAIHNLRPNPRRQEMITLGSHSIPTGERDSESSDHK